MAGLEGVKAEAGAGRAAVPWAQLLGSSVTGKQSHFPLVPCRAPVGCHGSGGGGQGQDWALQTGLRQHLQRQAARPALCPQLLRACIPYLGVVGSTLPPFLGSHPSSLQFFCAWGQQGLGGEAHGCD